jgi:hypothetical protein
VVDSATHGAGRQSPLVHARSVLVIPVTEIQLPADLDPEAAALILFSEYQWLMSQTPEPVSNVKGD